MSLTTGERLFPTLTTREAMRRETLVIWVIEEEQIPTIDEFRSTYEKIEPYLAKKERIRGRTILQVFALNPNKELSKADWAAYGQAGIRISRDTKGDEGERFDRMFLNILLYALQPDEYNFLILSTNKDFGQGTKFFSVRDSLREKGFHIAVTHPDHFKDFDDFERFGVMHSRLNLC